MGKNAKEIRRAFLKKKSEENSPENRQHPVDRILSVETIDHLRAHGLLLDDFPFFPSKHVAYPSGYIVGLPCNLGGNCLFYEDKPLMGPKLIELDMPTINIWKSDMISRKLMAAKNLQQQLLSTIFSTQITSTTFQAYQHVIRLNNNIMDAGI